MKKEKILSLSDGNISQIEKQIKRTGEPVPLKNELPAILFISSFPPRECGIATYSQDLIGVLEEKFGSSFQFLICPLENDSERNIYDDDRIEYTLNTEQDNSYIKAANRINSNPLIELVFVQHEFGFFHGKEEQFLKFLRSIKKPITFSFHTVLPTPSQELYVHVKEIAAIAQRIMVMTHNSVELLEKYYEISPEKLEVVPHGTHLVKYENRDQLKLKYDLAGKKVLSTFGLLGPGKSIETTLDALPKIIERNKDVIFLIIGKTHPGLKIKEGETYREFLQEKIKDLGIAEHVRFLNRFMQLEELLEYLQLSDIYLFTSKDPNQAVSGTFSYALSCGCPIISTPIPHVLEVLKNDTGIVIDFENSSQLSDAVNKLLSDDHLRGNMSLNAMHQSASTAWENVAILHMRVFEKLIPNMPNLSYGKPDINLSHLKKMTTQLGIIQFSKINHPDIDSGYTLDDNARALIAACKHYELSRDKSILPYIKIYLDFVHFCYQGKANFLNYVNEKKEFTDQNNEVNLEDSIGRAIWALGYFISKSELYPKEFSESVERSESIINQALDYLPEIYSTRAMAFAIKGLYFYNLKNHQEPIVSLISEFAKRMQQMYRHESRKDWHWYESYLTYGHAVLPDAMLCAYLSTSDEEFKQTAQITFKFLLSKIYCGNSISVISNKNWCQRDEEVKIIAPGGEQPIDVAYTILALQRFNQVFPNKGFDLKMEEGFNWFVGDNHLNEIIYNTCTGGCYDGLEEKNINLNQGAESTISYLLSRMAFGYTKSIDRSNSQLIKTKKFA